jgi:hypothetical protein
MPVVVLLTQPAAGVLFGGCAMSATDTPVKVSREILEDRWAGLMDVDLDPSELNGKLWKSFEELYNGVARTVPDDNGLYADQDLVSELLGVVRAHVIRRVDELGIAQ